VVARPARVVAVGLGPAGPELVTVAARRAIDEASIRFVRTSRHPAAAVVPGASSFDQLYESASRFEDVYRAIVEALVAAAIDHGQVLYAVPGSPRVAEATVELLAADQRVELEVVAGLSFLELVWDRLGIDPLAASPRLVDAAGFAETAAGDRGPLVVAQCWSRQLLSEVKLSFGDDPPDSAVILHHLGLADEQVLALAWEDLDRAIEPDHLTTVWVPQIDVPIGAPMEALTELVRTLRQRCPWDRAQTHQSLTRHLIEESYEVVEAIDVLGQALLGDDSDGGDLDASYAHLEEELGDLLFQVCFHANLAAEQGRFDLTDVARGVHDKLVGRHPHVFGDSTVDSAEQVAANWEQIKKAEKGRASIMDGIPAHLPALHHAAKLQRKAASVGFDWGSAPEPLAKLAEQLAKLTAELSAGSPRVGEELGDLLFAAVSLARHLDVDPESALRGSSAEFRRRFEIVERLAAERGLDLATADPGLVATWWEQAKVAKPTKPAG
jgi:tetrapyrrole methylase family protein/MazG family protein